MLTVHIDMVGRCSLIEYVIMNGGWALNWQCTLDMCSYYYCVLHCDLNIIDVWYLGAQVKDWLCLLLARVLC